MERYLGPTGTKLTNVHKSHTGIQPASSYKLIVK